MTLLAADVYRAYETPGVPASGPHQPVKAEIRAWGTLIEALGTGGGPGLGYTTLAVATADLAHAEGVLSIVYADAVAANNGLYKKIGGSGVGSWSRIGDLPNSIVRLTVTGGTGDAIVATAPETPTVPGSKLYLLTPTAANTTTTTIAVNGVAPVEIKNAFGVSLAANSLLNNSQVLMAWAVDHYQLLLSANPDASAFTAACAASASAASTSASAAATSASALGNQVYQYDTYALAQAATVPVGVHGMRLFGYTAYGDGPTSEYFRVALQPSTANKIRTTDRFLPNGSTDATNGGWWQMVISGAQDVRKFGVFGDGATDVTTKINGALTACSIFVPPSTGNYIMSGDLIFVSNRYLGVQRGANIVNTGGRFTAFLPGGGNVEMEINGTVGFLATATAPGIGDWPDTVPGGTHRGLIECGGTHVSIGSNFRVHGSGRVYSDYVWTGVPVGYPNFAYQMNRKGIAFIIATNCVCEGLEVDHIWGEAIYMNGFSNSLDNKFLRNYVHDVAFDALNFNTGNSTAGHEIAFNRVLNAQSGIEVATGSIHDNYVENTHIGITFGAGGGLGPLYVTNNTVVTTVDFGYSLQFGTIVQNIHITGNMCVNAGTTAYILANVQDFQFKNNSSYAHATIGPAFAINIQATCSNGHIDGNLMTTSGAFSSGFLSNSASAGQLGTNKSY